MAKNGPGTTCKECDMEQKEWTTKQGVVKNGTTYCCAGCAEHTGCTCDEGYAGNPKHEAESTRVADAYQGDDKHGAMEQSPQETKGTP